MGITDTRFDPVGTRIEHERTADFPPHARELVRKRYPDGTVRAWFRQRGGPWREQHDQPPEPSDAEAQRWEIAQRLSVPVSHVHLEPGPSGTVVRIADYRRADEAL